MTKEELLKNIKSPLPNAILKKWPQGNITQFWSDNPSLYSASHQGHDDFHYYISGHTGIDIATQFRDPVYAAHDGFIRNIRTERTGLGGLVVWLESVPTDDGFIEASAYAHLDEFVVQQGQTMKQGDLIGYEGNTGMVADTQGNIYWGNAPANKGVHLHFGMYEYVWRNGAWEFANSVMAGSFDPLPWLTGDWSGTRILLSNISRWLSILADRLVKGRYT